MVQITFHEMIMEGIMATSDSTPKQAYGPLARDLVYAARYYLSGRRGILLLATVAALAGIAFSWSWLVAAGIAPLLLTALPCLVMCGLGLCMNKLLGGSCESNPAQSKMTEPIQSGNRYARQ